MIKTYVRANRKRGALSQGELANLLGKVSKDTVRRLETGRQKPTLEMALALEVVFGIPPQKLFPVLYDRIEEGVMARAKRFHEKLEAKNSAAAAQKRELLEAIPRGGIAKDGA